jgi:hypothetical protein
MKGNSLKKMLTFEKKLCLLSVVILGLGFQALYNLVFRGLQ